MTITRQLKSIAEALLSLQSQRSLLRNKIVKTLFIAASVVWIVSQQASFLMRPDTPPAFYRNVINLGASYQRYFAFFYYFGGFPVNLDRQKTATMQETKDTLGRLGARLSPESSVYNRASIFLFYPEAFLNGRPDTAEMRTGHAIWFTFSLLSVFSAFCYIGRPLFGLLVALLCGSDPFQVYELYHKGSATIFPTVISTGLVILAACFALSSERFARHQKSSILLACLCGVVCALQYEIRLEGVGVFAGALLSLIVCVPRSGRAKLALACVFAVSVFGTNAFMDRYFRASFAKANDVVASYGGTPTASGNPHYSTQWWALWSGLGDFDEKYGFLADDRAGISYYYGQNASQLSEILHRRNYLATVLHDPAWFARILAARFKRVLLNNTPYRLNVGSSFYDVRLPPVLVTLIGLLLLAAGLLIDGDSRLRSDSVNLLVLPLSIGAVAVGQLADYGLQFYCIVHLFLFAYVLCFALDAVLALAMWTVVNRHGPSAESVTLHA